MSLSCYLVLYFPIEGAQVALYYNFDDSTVRLISLEES